MSKVSRTLEKIKKCVSILFSTRQNLWSPPLRRCYCLLYQVPYHYIDSMWLRVRRLKIYVILKKSGRMKNGWEWLLSSEILFFRLDHLHLLQVQWSARSALYNANEEKERPRFSHNRTVSIPYSNFLSVYITVSTAVTFLPFPQWASSYIFLFHHAILPSTFEKLKTIRSVILVL